MVSGRFSGNKPPLQAVHRHSGRPQPGRSPRGWWSAARALALWSIIAILTGVVPAGWPEPAGRAAAAGFELTAEPQVFEGCRLIDAPWADGDSFPVRLPDGREVTLRLYEADCPEDKVGGDSDARRVREQRQHFGLETNQQVLDFGMLATDRARELLRQPFTVRTHFADGRGDPRYPRVYAWVELADGRDLAEVLVSEGLARAHGVYRGRPDGMHQEEARTRMAALELAAAVRGRGAWADTDWDKLPQDRQQARRDEIEMAELTGGNGLRDGETIDINRASRDELMRLPGIGEVRALDIVATRPFADVDDIVRVRGIGPATLEKIREWIVVGDE